MNKNILTITIKEAFKFKFYEYYLNNNLFTINHKIIIQKYIIIIYKCKHKS